MLFPCPSVSVCGNQLPSPAPKPTPAVRYDIRPVPPVVLREVRTRADLRRFIDLPWRIYNPTDHPQWVPPLKLVVRDNLDDRRNPFYPNASRALFLAEKNGEVVGRIAAIENRAHNAVHGDRVGFWG
ncbi:MAG: hypothetical protein RLZZ621_1671, partial [Gemmatimonadota bacterium]